MLEAKTATTSHAGVESVDQKSQTTVWVFHVQANFCMLHLLCREDGLNSNSSAAGIGSDWFEGALVRPDIVLSDVARAINSSNVPKVCLFLPSALRAQYSVLRARCSGLQSMC